MAASQKEAAVAMSRSAASATPPPLPAAAAPSREDKGKGKARESPDAASSQQSSTATQGAKPAAPAAPYTHTQGDWTAVWNAERKQYYFWNKKTGRTTWTNPLVGGSQAAATAAEGTAAGADASPSGSVDSSGTSQSLPARPQQPPLPGQGPPASTAAQPPLPGAAPPLPAGTPAGSAGTLAPEAAPEEEYLGGIDPELAYLDPGLAARRRAVGSGGLTSFTAQFNSRTGRFEGDPTRREKIAEIGSGRGQNRHYFDYDNWQKTLALEQEAAGRKRGLEGGASGGPEQGDAARKRLSKKEMQAIRERNQEKKEKRQKGWLMG